MKFEEYESKFYSHYSEFAETIKFILERSIEAKDIPRPQSIQFRAKAPDKLKQRLVEDKVLESESIETKRGDLAGARIIFYTNNDVSRFLGSRLIFENFEVEPESTKIHHQTYRAHHYTVKLKQDRANLSEYSKFSGLRCEIQIHTILNHAWSETSHDIIYKNPFAEGFGSKEMESITKRFLRIMEKYLIPAGFEFQRIQDDFERLKQHKKLFDRDLIALLPAATNNNERFDLLSSIKSVLPSYDDVAKIYGDLVDPLLRAAEAAKQTPTQPQETEFGPFDGKTAADVATIVVEIFELLRFVDVEKTFEALFALAQKETDEKVTKKIQEATVDLAKYDLDVWRKVGPAIQVALVDILEQLTPEQKASARYLIVAIYEAVLSPEISGTSWTGDSVTLRSGVVPLSDSLREIRRKAIDGLFNLFDAATADPERRQTYLALRQATRTPTRAVYSDEWLNLTLTDGVRIAKFFREHTDELSYELRETLEHDYLFDYHRARELAQAEPERFGARKNSEQLMEQILEFRDRLNQDLQFVRYKTLVGYESVFASQWEDEDQDYTKRQEYRTEQAASYIEAINPETEEQWFGLIERCAQTKSNDLAMFPVFGVFLRTLAEKKPETTERLLASASPNVLGFSVAMLDGLKKSGSPSVYIRTIQRFMTNGIQLWALMKHWQSFIPSRRSWLRTALNKAIEIEDDYAVMESLYLAFKLGGRLFPTKADFFLPALTYLTERKDARWARMGFFAKEAAPFFDALEESEAKLMLENLLEAPKIDYPLEQLLIQISRHHLSLVWDFFRQRMEPRDKKEDDQYRYEEIPYRFHGLEKELCRDAKLAVTKGRDWYAQDSSLFRFRAGRLLSAAFPSFPLEFANELAELVTNGSESDAQFVLAIMQNYHGEPPTHEVLKRIIAKYPGNDSMRNGVVVSFDNTGPVWGQFGFADAMRQKKAAMETWLPDSRPDVRAFAQRHIRELDLRIAYEQQRGEEDAALRELKYDTSDDEGEGAADGDDEQDKTDDPTEPKKS